MKPGPNAPCPCGSGRKYKKCHGAPAARPAPAGGQGLAEWLARGRAFEASGRLPDAERCYQRALERDPRSAEAWLALGDLALRAGDAAAARECYGRLVALHPDHAHGHFALGNVHALLYAFDAARAEYARTLELAPTHAGAWGNLGNVEKYCGRLAAALDCCRHAIACEPTVEAQAKRASNRLLALHYDESLAHDDLYAAHREWAERYARPWYPERPAWPNARDPARKLRLGYVSGSLSEQAIVGHFLQGVLETRDRSQFDVTLYSSTPGPESAKAKLRAVADRWVEIGALSDADAALRIRADAIDVLVDLDGHNPSGRLLIFARKPAPVQVEWLDWFDTSGLDTIDYVLTDPYTTPQRSPQRFSETPIRLPASRLCYTPAADAPPVAPMPVAHGAPFTFGSFNRQDKLTPQVLAAWARILDALPDARLLVKNRALAAGAVRQSVESRFAELGTARERLVLRGPSPHAQMLAEYADVDVALDPFPYNGGLTTCECLWMGVPIVALEGERMISRQSAAMLRVLGLDDWVAASVDEYVRVAVAKRANAAAAGALRAELRPRFARSALCDAAGFARDLESAYRAMWQRYCTGAGAGS